MDDFKKKFRDEEKDYKKQDKQKIRKGDTVRITKARKNDEGEWNVKVFVNGKNYKPAEIFADSKEDAEQQAQDAKDLYKRKGATVVGEKGSAKKEEEKEEPDFEEPSLREEIMKLSGLLLNEYKGFFPPGEAMRLYKETVDRNNKNRVADARTVRKIKRIANREKKGGGKASFDEKGNLSVVLANGKEHFLVPLGVQRAVTNKAPNNVDIEDFILYAAQGW